MSTLGPVAFTTISQSGSGLSWDSSGDWGPTTLWKNTTNTRLESIPTGITSIASGSQLDNLKVTFYAYSDGIDLVTHYSRLTGGTWISNPLTTSSTLYTLDGDASYWGLTATPSEIFSGLKDGSIKFEYYHKATDSNGGEYGHVTTVRATLTYTTPDTKRASLIIPL